MKRRDVVDVTVRLLGVDALLHPDDLLDAQVVFRSFMYSRSGSLQGSNLRAYLGQMVSSSSSSAITAEQVRPGDSRQLVGHDEGTLAVNGNGTALQDHVIGTVRAASRELGHLEGDLVVGAPREVQAVHKSAVRVEVPVVRALLALVVHGRTSRRCRGTTLSVVISSTSTFSSSSNTFLQLA